VNQPNNVTLEQHEQQPAGHLNGDQNDNSGRSEQPKTK
jgi:hypothetical protein